MSATLRISFTPPSPVPPLGYKLWYRSGFDPTPYTELDLPNSTTSPYDITGLTEGLNWNGMLQGICGYGKGEPTPVDFSVNTTSKFEIYNDSATAATLINKITPYSAYSITDPFAGGTTPLSNGQNIKKTHQGEGGISFTINTTTGSSEAKLKIYVGGALISTTSLAASSTVDSIVSVTASNLQDIIIRVTDATFTPISQFNIVNNISNSTIDSITPPNYTYDPGIQPFPVGYTQHINGEHTGFTNPLTVTITMNSGSGTLNVKKNGSVLYTRSIDTVGGFTQSYLIPAFTAVSGDIVLIELV